MIPRILVHFPTRGRREQFLSVLDLYRKQADNNEAIYYQIVVDNDDPEMRPELLDRTITGVGYWYGNSKTKIEACNAFVDNIRGYDWKILVLASDDMIPLVYGWDTVIREKMMEHFPDFSGVLHFHDQHQGDNINTFSVMGRGWYERFGYVYNPIYRTMYCDTEYTFVTRIFRKVVQCPENIIEHLHPYSGAAKMDATYEKNNDSSFDAEIYSRRKLNRFFLKTTVIIQPGRTGDILISLPIAKHFADQNHIVYWVCPKEYHDIFRNIDYVFPVENALPADQVIDLSFGFGGAPEQWWQNNKQYFFSFVEAKYYLAGVNMKERWNLKWNRNYSKERELFRKLNLTAGQYVLIHDTTHSGKIADIDVTGNIVEFKPIEGFNIFDWYTVIENAAEIHCIDSALSNFIEGCPELRHLNKTIYLYCRESEYYLRSIYKNRWTVSNQEPEPEIPVSTFEIDMIIPCYKRPKLLKALLNSLSPPDHIRIIFSFDGPPDEQLGTIIEKYAENNPEINVQALVNPHRGVAPTLLAALRMCRESKCIITLDADFVVNRNFFPELSKAIALHGDGNTIITGFNAPAHRATGRKGGLIRKRTIGGGNLCFTWAAAVKHVIPSLSDNMWDFNLSHRVIAAGGNLLCIVPSVCQHMGDRSTLGHRRVDKANDFNY